MLSCFMSLTHPALPPCPLQAELAKQRDLNARMRHELAEQAQAAEEAAQAEEAEASQLAAAQARVGELESRLAELHERCQLAEKLAEVAEGDKAQLEAAAAAAAGREGELQVGVGAGGGPSVAALAALHALECSTGCAKAALCMQPDVAAAAPLTTPCRRRCSACPRRWRRCKLRFGPRERRRMWVPTALTACLPGNKAHAQCSLLLAAHARTRAPASSPRRLPAGRPGAAG